MSRFIVWLKQLLPLVGLLGLIAFFSWRSEFFFDAVNFQNLVNDAAPLLLCAFGMTLVILIGEIDLSVGAVASLLAIFLAQMLGQNMPWPAALLLVIFIGAGMGLLGGTITVLGGIASFITTLGIASMAAGLTHIVTQSRAVSIVNLPFLELFYGRNLLGLPVPLLLVAGAFALCWVLLNRTAFGHELAAIGVNREAARLAGIRVAQWRMAVFALMGALVALGAALSAARLGSGAPDANPTLTLDVIAAVVIGGASLHGGRAVLGRTLLGALLIAVLNNGLTLLNVNSYYQFVIKGVIILGVVLLDRPSAQEHT